MPMAVCHFGSRHLIFPRYGPRCRRGGLVVTAPGRGLHSRDSAFLCLWAGSGLWSGLLLLHLWSVRGGRCFSFGQEPPTVGALGPQGAALCETKTSGILGLSELQQLRVAPFEWEPPYYIAAEEVNYSSRSAHIKLRARAHGTRSGTCTPRRPCKTIWTPLRRS